MILLGYQNIKIFYKKDDVPNWSEEASVIKKAKNTVLWIYVINDLKEK